MINGKHLINNEEVPSSKKESSSQASTTRKVDIPTPHASINSVGEGDFNFLMASCKEYEERRQNLERCGLILYFLRCMLDEVTFNKWCV